MGPGRPLSACDDGLKGVPRPTQALDFVVDCGCDGKLGDPGVNLALHSTEHGADDVRGVLQYSQLARVFYGPKLLDRTFITRPPHPTARPLVERLFLSHRDLTCGIAHTGAPLAGAQRLGCCTDESVLADVHTRARDLLARLEGVPAVGKQCRLRRIDQKQSGASG